MRGGEAREVSEPEWAGEMRGWAGREAGRESVGWAGLPGDSGVEVVGQGLVELEGTDAKRWSGTGSGSAGSNAGV
jgi:hypothetical protein